MRWLLVLFLLVSACRPTEGALEKVEAARERNDGPAMWVATDDDSTVYLYGTLHLMPPDLDWRRPDMREAFARSGTVFFEVPSTPEARERAQALTFGRGSLPPTERLTDGFDSYERRLLEAAALQGDVPLEALERLRPWLASNILLVAAAEQAGLSPELAADEALKSRARRAAKNIQYLDTVDDQIALSADAGPEEQRTELRATLEGYNRLAATLGRIAEAWVKGDVQQLERLARDPMTGPALDRILLRRNGAWAERLAQVMEESSGTMFVAVGVAHLIGEGSLQDELEARGVEVERYLAYRGENVIATVDLDGAEE